MATIDSQPKWAARPRTSSMVDSVGDSEQNEDECIHCMRQVSRPRRCSETGQSCVGSRRQSRVQFKDVETNSDDVNGDTHHDGRLKSTASFFHGRRNSASFQPGTRRGSLATRAVEQLSRNEDFTRGKDLEIRQLAEESRELQDFVQMGADALNEQGSRLTRFQEDCMQALMVKKAAGRLLRGVKARRVTRLDEEPGHGGRGIKRTLVHRSVMKTGSITSRFQSAKQGAAAHALRARPQSAAMARPPQKAHLPPRPASAPLYTTAASSRPRRTIEPGLEMRLRAAAARSIKSADRASKEADERVLAPTVNHRALRAVLLDHGIKDDESDLMGLLSPGGSSGTSTVLSSPRSAGPSTAAPPAPPAIAAWAERRRHRNTEATLCCFAGTMPDRLKVLTTRVDWSSMLDQQKREMKHLDSSDANYRNMLGKFERYQAVIQKRLDALLQLDSLLPPESVA